jgi:hypothetical protein
MMDKALVLENRRAIMERKRKMQRTGAQGSHKKFHDGSSQGSIFRSNQQQRMHVAAQGFQTPQRQIEHPNFQSPCFAPPPLQRNNNTQNSGIVGPCYSYCQTGHYANRCPRKQAKQTLAPNTNQQNLTCNTNNNATTLARQNQAHAHVNHVAIKDA